MERAYGAVLADVKSSSAVCTGLDCGKEKGKVKEMKGKRVKENGKRWIRNGVNMEETCNQINLWKFADGKVCCQ